MAFIPALARAIYNHGYIPLTPWHNVTRQDASNFAKKALETAAEIALNTYPRTPSLSSIAQTSLLKAGKAFLHSKTASTPISGRKNHHVRSIHTIRRYRHRRLYRFRCLYRKQPRHKRRRRYPRRIRNLYSFRRSKRCSTPFMFRKYKRRFSRY